MYKVNECLKVDCTEREVHNEEKLFGNEWSLYLFSVSVLPPAPVGLLSCYCCIVLSLCQKRLLEEGSISQNLCIKRWKCSLNTRQGNTYIDQVQCIHYWYIIGILLVKVTPRNEPLNMLIQFTLGSTSIRNAWKVKCKLLSASQIMVRINMCYKFSFLYSQVKDAVSSGWRCF